MTSNSSTPPTLRPKTSRCSRRRRACRSRCILAPHASTGKRGSPSSFMRVRTLVAAVAVTAAAACAARGGDLELVVDDIRGARIVHAERVDAGAAFVLSYVHSSEHVAVRGAFEVGADGRLTVLETAFSGFGPGLPALR